MNETLNQTQLLLNRDSLLVDGYYRLITDELKVRFTLVIKDLIAKYIIDGQYRLYKIIDLIKILQKICKDRDYFIVKHFSITNWNNDIKFHFGAYPHSFKSKYLITFNLINLKCDIFLQKSTSETKFTKQLDCSCGREDWINFHYPKNGENVKVLVHLYNIKGTKRKYALKITIMDFLLNELAQLSSIITGSIENTSLYLEWDNVITDTSLPSIETLPSYQNGTLLIEAFPKNYHKSQTQIRVKREDWNYFDYDYVLKLRE